MIRDVWGAASARDCGGCANPLADVRNTAAIHAVVVNGRYFDRAALDRLLAETLGLSVR